MGSIRERQKKDGKVRFTAQIILKRKGQPTYREAATFARRGEAAAWIRKREEALRKPGGVDRARMTGATVGDAIDRYVDSSIRKIGRTKAQVLETIRREYTLAAMDAGDVGPEDIVAFAQELAGRGIKPQTIQNYISHLGAIFAIAKPAWGIQLDRTAMADAVAVLKSLGMVSKSDRRDRRPSLHELDRLMQFFLDRHSRSPGSAPMHRIIAYAIFSTRRQDEIVRPWWRHLDEDGSRILIEDMKHPGQKRGNDVWCDLTPEALAIIKSMPRQDGPIFPYTADAISAAFTRACYTVGINSEDMPDEDRLHFHDLRHDGVSRLFEIGWGAHGKGTSIPHVAAVSGHRSWQSLQRYTHLRQTGDKYADWKWLPIVTEPIRTDRA